MKFPLALFPIALLPLAVANADTRSLFEDWRKDPGRHPNLPDVSYAGYHAGEQPPPDLPVVTTVTDHGAVPGGNADATAAFVAAIKVAGDKGGGAVLVPAGVWKLAAPLLLTQPGVVLRGEGSAKSILLFTRPLAEAVGPNLGGSKSRWSWAGGMVWIAPGALRGDVAGQLGELWSEGWRPGSEIASVTAPARRGDPALILGRGGVPPKAGTRLLLELTDPGDHSLWRHLCGDLPGTIDYDWPTRAAGILQDPQLHWPVEVATSEPGRVTLRQPLRFDVRPEWRPRLVETGPVIRECGVESLTIRMENAPLSAHLENPGWNGIYFENAWDCWARDVVVENADNGIGTAASKCITIDGFTISGRAAHHATFCRRSSHDILWTRFRITCKPHHGLNVEGLSAGNVWSSGDLEHGTLDSHRALPFENVRTDLRIINDGVHGGSGDAGPLFGARFAHWNITVRNARPHMVHVAPMMPYGAVVAVRGTGPEPKPYPDFAGGSRALVDPGDDPIAVADLHLAQLTHRLGRPPLHLGGPIRLTVRRSDGTRLRLEWLDPQTTPQTYRIERSTGGGPREAFLAEVAPPDRHFEDADIEPGNSYVYRIRSLLEGRADAAAEIHATNRPAPVLNLSAEVPGLDPRVVLRWEPTEERGGEILVSRRTKGAAPGAGPPVATLPVTALTHTDNDAEAGTEWMYSVIVRNPSGLSPVAEIETLTRATGTTRRTETFAVATESGLPTKGTLGTWHWKGTARDRGPTLRPGGSELDPASADGELAWGITAQGVQSFFWTPDVRVDLSKVGAELACDFQVGRSGISSHTLAPCVQLADGTWLIAGLSYVGPTMGWKVWRAPLGPQTTWKRFDPEKLTTGDPVGKPDLTRVIGIGFLVGRPINNRFIQFDNVRVFGIHAAP